LAKAIYTSTEGAEVRIDYCVWVGSCIRFESLGVGETRELVLFLECDGDVCVLEDRRDSNVHFSEEFSWFRVEHMKDIKSVTITLVDTTTLSKRTFALEVAGEKGSLRTELDAGAHLT
jgi:hypothetical protein